MSPREIVRTAFLHTTPRNIDLVLAARLVVVHAVVVVVLAVGLLWLWLWF